jgi:signal-transduction protein with cAMP-binding, CBS, and nucleotidyltransferase domain/PAS domain-containing protein
MIIKTSGKHGMSASLRKINLRKFFQNIILPTLLTIGLFVVLIFAYIIPAFERNMLNSKKEMIRELVSAANGIASKYYLEMKAGLISEGDAKSNAISRIEHLRYGVGNKDYFWITDMQPFMIMHPYRKDLNGTDLNEFRDPNGKALFVEMVKRIKENNEGYVDYEWQWMDDSLNIVPKISYVHAFEPWGWIIGTGVYIEDVKSEISAIKKKLTLVSLAITGCMAFLLVLIARHNLRGEIKRGQAEAELQVSREKYKALVEASTEGTSMFLESECIFSNSKFHEMLGIGQTDHISADLREIIVPNRLDDIDKIRRFNAGTENFMLIETFLTPKNNIPLSALLSLSKVTLAGKQGLIVVVKELSRDDESDEEKSERGRQLLALSDASGVGIFKCTAGKSAKLIDVNDHLVSMLGFPSKESLLKAELSDLVDDDSELKEFLKTIAKEKSEKDFVLHIRRGNGLYTTVSVSAIAELDQSGEIQYLYGTMLDISNKSALEKQKEELYTEMQGRLLFMDQRVKSWAKEIVSCEMTLSVANVAKLMSSYKTEVALVRSSTGEYLGMLTDADIRRRVITPAMPLDRPVYEFMNSPLISIGEEETLSQAVILMQEKDIEHLCVRDNNNRIYGTVRKTDLVNLQHNTSAVLTAAVESALSVAELRIIYQRLPLYVNALSEGGAHTSVITNAITATSDAIGAKLEQFIIQDLGSPLVPYAFVALGSEGRREQTLLTDQDNAIIYKDAEEDRKDEVKEYFANYGRKMCSLLDEIGFHYCTGNIMANNPRWNQPLSEWRRYFATWTTQPEPKHLLESAIFFDFRLVCGERALIVGLANHVQQLLVDNPSFLGHLAREGMNYKTPLGLFGKIQTESDEEHGKGLNIKSPLRVIVNLVRLYAMKHQLLETNSIKRMQRLYEANIFSLSFYKNILYAYDYMMVLQLRTQACAFSHGKDITNYVDLSNLSTIELNTLKNVLSQLGIFQNKAKYDFGVSE